MVALLFSCNGTVARAAVIPSRALTFKFGALLFFFAAFPKSLDCDKNVTIVTKFPFSGGSLSGGCDPPKRDADLLLQSHFSRYQGLLIV